MKKATYFKNGRFVESVSSSAEIYEDPIKSDLAVVEGIYDNTYYYDGSAIKKPEKPSPHHIFDYTTKQWIDPRTPATEWPIVRAERNRLLQASDWTQLPDVPLATKEAWAAYRQALRDVTLQPDPFNIVWPTPPA